MAKQTPSKQIYDVLVSKNFDPQLLNKEGMPAQDPSDADVFSFDWVAKSGKDYGTVVIMFGDEHDMTIYFGDNVGKSMEDDDKKEWFDFLYQLRMLAKRNLQSFSIQNLNKLKYNMKSMSTAVKEGLFESWIGTRTHSWNARPTEARLMIKHSKVIGEGDARYRYVESLFIETVEGERFKLPFTKISAAKAMLEHVKQGGKPYDARGNHITQIVNEMNVLTRFYRANKNVITEDEAEQQLIEEVAQYHANLKSQLGKMSSKRGYTNYFETWNPEITTEQDMVIEGIRTLFATESGTQRIERALPALAKIKTQGNTMKEIGIFEGWMACLAEGTWSLPDTPEKQQKLIQLLSKELPVGPDATDVTEQLYDILGDDDLFDQLESLAKEDANADARTIIINRLEQMASNPAVAQVIGKLKIEQKPAEETPEPEAEQPVKEDYDREADVKRIADSFLASTGLGSYEDLSAEDIEYIGGEAQCNYQGVCDILEIDLPEELGPVKSYDTDEEGNEYDLEESETLAELSRDTLKSYIKKAGGSSDERSASNLSSRAAWKLNTPKDQDDYDDGDREDHKSYMRSKGIARAVDKLEEVNDESNSNSWSHEGDWEKIKKRAGKAVDARGEVTNLAGKELQKAKKISAADVGNKVKDMKFGDEQSFKMSDFFKEEQLDEAQSIADYKKKIAAMPDAEVKSLLTVMVGHNRDNPWDKGIITLLKRELDNRSEQLDEIGDTPQGKKALGKYVKAAASNRAMRTFDQGYDANDDIVFDKVNDRKQANRGMGISRAVDRLTKEEQLDELSPDTLKSYAKKASSSVANLGASLGKKQADADEVDRYTNRHMPNQSDERERMRSAVGAGYDDISQVRSKANKRVKGIGKAVDRLSEDDEDTSPVESAILNRIMNSHTDLLSQYGPQAVMNAARDEAEFVGDVDEIGTSDVSAWVKNVIWGLEKSAEYLKSKKVDEDADDLTDMTAWMEKFDDQEDRNYHMENAVDVAELVGTPDDKKLMQAMMHRYEMRGHLSQPDSKLRNEVMKRLWPIVQKKEADWNNRVNSSKIADEGMIGKVAGTLAGDALGGPVGGAIGGAAGDALQDKFFEGTALQGQYGHAGKMAPVKAEQFGDKFAEDIARLKALALIK